MPKLAPSLGMVSWGRLHTLLEATIIKLTRWVPNNRPAAAAQERFVRLGRNSEHGLKLIIARATAGDAIWFKATIDRIADILTHQGDTDPVEVRRSKPSASSPNPPEPCSCSANTNTMIGTDPPNPPNLQRNQPGTRRKPHLPILPRKPSRPTVEESAEDNQDEGAFAEAEHNAEPADDAAGTRQAPQQPTADPARGEAGQDMHRSLRLIPPPFHPDRAAACVIYIHLSEEAVRGGNGIARVEDVGPVLLNRLRTLLGEHCTINLKPVIDLPAGQCPVDSYHIPARLREQLHLRYPADVFPYAAAVSRRIDLDHTIPYLSPDRGGPPGQTRIGNLGPHTRRNHRLKTMPAGRSDNPNPAPGSGDHPTVGYLVNATGTHPLGNTTYAQTIWRAATLPHDLAS